MHEFSSKTKRTRRKTWRCLTILKHFIPSDVSLSAQEIRVEYITPVSFSAAIFRAHKFPAIRFEMHEEFE